MVPRASQVQPPNDPPSYRARSNSTKQHSIRSFSSSFEADDERSESSLDRDSMMDREELRPRPKYPGEDVRPTSRKELFGWYAYGFAAEVFVICGMGSFVPINLEQLARENGVLLSDRTKSCTVPSRSSITSDPDLLQRIVTGMTTTVVKDTGQCVVNILGVEINTASFAMYTFSISVALQALLVVSISCAADHGPYRKRLLLGFAFTGAIATMLFLPIGPNLYLLGALLAIIANTCLGASFVLLNSFLPLLVRHHPRVEAAEMGAETPFSENFPLPPEEELVEPNDNDPTLVNSTAALLPPIDEAISEISPTTSLQLELSTQISSRGVGIGYSASLFLQCISIIILLFMHSTNFSLRLVIFLIGTWWLLFTIPAAINLRPRPGPPLPDLSSPSNTPGGKSSRRSWPAYLVHSWKALFRTARLAYRLKDILLFLTAWFLISDAIATVSGTAILFAKTTLHMQPSALALINVIGTTTGVLGAFGWSSLSRTLHLAPHQTILACICLFELIPLYGLLGYFPSIQRLGYLGLQQPWEMYLLGFIYGFVLGGFSSYCRSLFGELIPPGSEAQFYALYAITDKGSSVFGPAIVGAIVDRTGEIRPAFWFLAVLVGVPGFFIWFVDTERGKREAVKLAGVIEGIKDGERNGNGNGHGSFEGLRGRGRSDSLEGFLAGEDGEDDREEYEHGREY